MDSNLATIGVVGCGVAGLTTSIRLLQGGKKVTILAKEIPPFTTSDKAGAIWLPYKIGPRNKVLSWALITYRKLERLSKKKKTGVSMVHLLRKGNVDQDNWWLEDLNNKLSRPIADVQNDAESEYQVRVPFVDTPIYMHYLLRTFNKLGGKLIYRKVRNLYKLQKEYGTVVNCSGLGARKLCKDTKMYPIKGQIVLINPVAGVDYIADDRPNRELTYIFPRSKDCILGGTSEDGVEDQQVDEKTTRDILMRCSQLVPQLENAKPHRVYVGIRPGRPEIRLEKEAELPLFHNYGHGGAGFTVSWGCAEEIWKLIKKMN